MRRAGLLLPLPGKYPANTRQLPGEKEERQLKRPAEADVHLAAIAARIGGDDAPLFPISGRHQFLALDAVVMPVADQLLPAHVLVVAGADDDLTAAVFVMPALDQHLLERDGAAERIDGAGLVLVRYPHALGLLADERLVPDAIAHRAVHGRNPLLFAHGAIDRLDPDPIGGGAVVDVSAAPVAVVRAALLAILILPVLAVVIAAVIAVARRAITIGSQFDAIAIAAVASNAVIAMVARVRLRRRGQNAGGGGGEKGQGTPGRKCSGEFEGHFGSLLYLASSPQDRPGARRKVSVHKLAAQVQQKSRFTERQ